MAVQLEDSATYQLAEYTVIAGLVGYGWWQLHEKGVTGDRSEALVWSVSPDGIVYEGSIELVKEKPLRYRPIGQASPFISADLVYMKESPYKPMQKPKNKDGQHESEFKRMMGALNAETSDRAVAIIGAAFLDDRLMRVIQAFFINSDKLVKEIFNLNGVLGAAGARRTIAFSLGLLDAHEYHDIGIIQKIRNDFAHKTDDLAFSTVPIVSRCNDLQIPRIRASPELYRSYAPRYRYVLAVADIAASLATAQFHAQLERRKTPEPRPWRVWHEGKIKET